MALYSFLVRGKNLFKKFLYAYLPSSITYKQSKKSNIAVFSSRRGGSTLMAELVSCDPDFRYIDQPFDITPLGINRNFIIKHVPNKYLSQFIEIEDSESEQINTYVSGLFSGKYPFLSKPHKWPVKRSVLKICNALPLINWFEENFGCQTIFLIRHPVPQALSVIKNHWIFTSEAYLKSKLYSSILTSVQLDFAHRIIEQGSLLEKGILNWVLENYVPLKNSKFLVTYEELVTNPIDVLNIITNKFDLSNIEQMVKRMNKPSASKKFSDIETNQEIQNGNQSFLLNKWKKDISIEESTKIQEILTMYAIDIYNVSDVFPQHQYLIAAKS